MTYLSVKRLPLQVFVESDVLTETVFKKIGLHYGPFWRVICLLNSVKAGKASQVISQVPNIERSLSARPCYK